MADAATLHTLFIERLQGIVGLDGAYDAEVPASPPTDTDGRILSYAVLYHGPGLLHATALDGVQDSLQTSIQVNCYGGDIARCLECVDLVRTRFPGAVSVDGVSRLIRLREEEPRNPLDDPDVWPPRYYVPVEFWLFTP